MRIFNYRLILLLSITFIFGSCSNDDILDDSVYEDLPDLSERLNAGGGTTVFLSSSNAFSTPSTGLSGQDLEDHFFGDAQFEAAFVTAPASINGGIGPIFSNTSCVSCHPKDGRSAFPTNLNALSGFLMRISLPGVGVNGEPVSVSGFGTQIQNQAIFGYQAEAKLQVSFTNMTEILSDGTQIELKKPSYSLFDTYVSLPSNALFSPRLAPPVFGLGLIEAITDANILASQDINDANGDGISGKANLVYDVVSGQTKVGKFGWKANTATILEQCAAAYNNDMGITSYLLSQETGYQQTNGNDGLGDDPEITKEILEKVATYCKTLGVPAPRSLSSESVRKGAKIFERLECANCHTPKQKSGYSPIVSISNQTFFPYSDMLLHDMGDDLADNRPDFIATGNEWKTRPLWGIGLTQVVNGHSNFLHDGRAKNITEAILWHGGEAKKSKDKFKQLSTKDRNDLLNFINSL
jgi:CxxC motif-containing protein (DUF1111 family)